MRYRVLVVEDNVERAAAIVRLRFPLIELRVRADQDARADIEEWDPDIIFGTWNDAREERTPLDRYIWGCNHSQTRQIIRVPLVQPSEACVERTLQSFVDKALTGLDGLSQELESELGRLVTAVRRCESTVTYSLDMMNGARRRAFEQNREAVVRQLELFADRAARLGAAWQKIVEASATLQLLVRYEPMQPTSSPS